MIATLTLLGVTFGVALGSALLPLISVEVFVIVTATSEPALHWAAIAAVVAAGQVIGKLPYYLAARGDIHLPAFMHRKREPAEPPTARQLKWRLRTKRMRMWIETIRERCHAHPGWMIGTYGVSSVSGLPPYMATTVLAGLAEMRMSLFVSIGLAGRFIRFAALAASPAVFVGWFG